MNILNKFKRGLAAVLSLSVAMSAVFVFHFPLMKARAEGEHEHAYHNVGDPVVEWQAWEETDSLPDTAGSFYLTCDVEISKTWQPITGTDLCLNGHSITFVKADDDNTDEGSGEESDIESIEELAVADEEAEELESNVVIFVEDSCTFKLCDCSENNAGKITHSDDADGGGVEVDGIFEMYGGTISDNKSSENGGGVYVSGGGIFSMYGGKITENCATDCYGGGVYVYNGGTFNIFGGEISGNSAKNGSGVYTLGTMTAGGTAAIINNTVDNVFLPSRKNIIISSENSLSGESTKIGVTTQVKPAKAGLDDEGNEEPAIEVRIAESTDENSCSFFISDEDYKVIYVNGIIKLSDAEPSEDDNPSDKHEHDGIEFTPITDKELPMETGSYYLTEGVELNSTWIIEKEQDITLCLCENDIKAYGNFHAIVVEGKLTIYDCKDKGSVTHAEGASVGVEIRNGGSFAMYGGEISHNDGEGVTFEGSGSLTVGGTAKILDAVNLPSGKTITVDNLENGAAIWVKTADTPIKGNPVEITGDNGQDVDYSRFFHAVGENDENYEYGIKPEGGKVVLAVKEQEDPDEHTPHNEGEAWQVCAYREGVFPTAKGNYYLAEDITLNNGWAPAEGTTLCLNGHNFSAAIGSPNVTFCNCEDEGIATITVSAGNTITVGGTLKASITLLEGALIDVDGDSPLTGGKIRVTLANALKNGESAAITTANAGAYSARFESAEGYTVEVDKGVIIFKNSEQPPVIKPTGHIHPICGDDYCKEHVDITWTEWNSSTTLPTAAGSYYLTTDVALGARWNVSGDIRLCLNGYTITSNVGNAVVYVSSDLALCDCDGRVPTGIITHAGGVSGRGVYIAGGGALAMYGGAIRGNYAADGAGVYNDGTFTMRGGCILNNEATGVGGGLYNNGVAVVEGEIYGNSAAQGAGGVYQDGKLTVSQNAYIMSNTAGGRKSNVYLTDGSRLIIGTGFDGEVGVTLETNPKSTGSVTFAKGSVSAKTLDKIKSDSSSFTIKRSGDTLTLSRKASSSDDDDDDDNSAELDIKSKTAAQIPLADRTAIYEVLKTMPDWVVGAYFDISLYDDYNKISESSRNLDVKLTIPSSIRSANRVYKVVRVHDGKATLLDDIDNDPNTITVRSRYFSTYAIVYSVAQSAASANGNGTNGAGGNGANGGYGNPAMGVQNEIPIAGLACGFTVLALAAPGKKIDNV